MNFFKHLHDGVDVLNDINILNQRKNYANSILSSDPNTRNISSVREHCRSKLHIQQLKSVFFKVFLPIFLLILLLYFGIENSSINLGLIAWALIGLVWTMWWDKYSYTLKEFNLGLSKTITIDDCGFN